MSSEWEGELFPLTGLDHLEALVQALKEEFGAEVLGEAAWATYVERTDLETRNYCERRGPGTT